MTMYHIWMGLLDGTDTRTRVGGLGGYPYDVMGQAVVPKVPIDYRVRSY